MATYSPPLRDLRFTLEHLVDLPALSKLAPFAQADLEAVMGLWEKYAAFVAAVLAPLDWVGDTVGSQRDPATGHVPTPPGFVDSYRHYVDAGWGSVPFPVEHGGGG